MKSILLVSLLLIGSLCRSHAQSTIITPGNLGNNIQSTSSKGGIQFPSMSFDDLKAIVNPLSGTTVFDTNCQCLRTFNGRIWMPLSPLENTFQAKGDFKVWQDATTPQPYPASIIQSTGMTSDSAGNVYVCGQTLGPMYYNNTAYSYPPNAAAEIGFVAKYNQGGILLWLKQITTDMGFVRPKQVQFDKISQSIYVVGEYVTRVQMQGSSGTISATTPMPIQFGAFTAKINAISGEGLWLKGEYGAGNLGSNITPNSLVVGSSGDVYLIGSIRGTLDSPPAGSGTISSGDNTTTDCFIIKYDTNGNRIWAKDLGTNNVNEVGNGISFANGKLYITGRFRSTTSFDGIPLTNTSFSENGFLARLNSTNGNCEWAMSIDGPGDDIGYDVAISKNNYLYVTGICSSTAANAVVFNNTNGATGTSLVTLNHTVDYFLARYSESGNVLNITRIGSTESDDFPPKITTDTTGNIYLATSPRSLVQMEGITAQGLNGRNALFIKYDANLRLQWYFLVNGYGGEAARGLTVLPSGWLFGTGIMNDIAYISNNTLNASQGSLFFVRYRE